MLPMQPRPSPLLCQHHTSPGRRTHSLALLQLPSVLPSARHGPCCSPSQRDSTHRHGRRIGRSQSANQAAATRLPPSPPPRCLGPRQCHHSHPSAGHSPHLVVLVFLYVPKPPRRTCQPTPFQGTSSPVYNPSEANDASTITFSRRVQKKCADGDIRAALRLLTTSDTFISPSEQTADALHAKHPPAEADEEPPKIPDPDQHRLTITEFDVMAAIKSSAPGSAAGLDGLRPLHLLQLVARFTAEAGQLDLGLTLNESKCEVTHLDDPGNTNTSDMGHVVPMEDSVSDKAVNPCPRNVVETLANNAENSGPHTDDLLLTAHRTLLTRLSILGSPIHARGSDEDLGKIKDTIRILIDRTSNSGSHATLFFLSRYAAVPRATYLLRSAPAHAANESLRERSTS
ncbi:hypothetical protein E2C01_055383 [Portunus trituberculatus]|uniref:Uncharacterized protein n=1 Tax=Portunus trituberculatus TaxID=210409 RepID=A0A5B7GUK3_PORTR|nr:hypothetical protein [Portunus trituberculatus]